VHAHELSRGRGEARKRLREYIIMGGRGGEVPSAQTRDSSQYGEEEASALQSGGSRHRDRMLLRVIVSSEM
jgi:hypothetical protein